MARTLNNRSRPGLFPVLPVRCTTLACRCPGPFLAVTLSVLLGLFCLPAGKGEGTKKLELSGARKLLHDPSPIVRLKAALALVKKEDSEAVPVLIDLLVEFPPSERQKIEEVLNALAGPWAPKVTLEGDDEISRRIRRDAWASWWQRTDGGSLLEEFRKRTLSAADLDKIRTLIAKLGDKAFAVRDKASAELVAYGTVIVPFLREAKSSDLEQQRRLENCLRSIANKGSRTLPPVAARLVALRKPAGAVETLLAFFPWAEDPDLADEVQKALSTLARLDDNAHAALVSALEDSLPGRRAVAAELLAGLRDPKHLAALRKLLDDADPRIRLCVALALVQVGNKDGVPALIALAADLPREQSWHAEDALRRLAGPKAPTLGPGNEPKSRRADRAAWEEWWKAHAATLDMAPLVPSVPRKPNVTARASKSGNIDTPDQAFDQDRKTAWNSRGFVPQWIEANLGVSCQLADIVLIVNQHPAGETVHEIWVSNEPIGDQETRAKRVHTFKGHTKSQQALKLDFPKELYAQYVQIRTTQSDGWVGWMEIELRVGGSRLSFIRGLGGARL